MPEPRKLLSKEGVSGMDAGESELARRIAAHRGQFLAFVRTRLHDAATAEDLVNETFIRALSHVNELRSDEAALAWFYRSLRNAVIDHHRRRGTADRALERWAAEADAIMEPNELAAPRLCRCVMKVAASLKPEYAEALERIEINEVAVRAFAEEHGISPSNAAVRVFRAREALRRGVIAACGACAEGGCVDCTCEDSVAHCAQGAAQLDVKERR